MKEEILEAFNVAVKKVQEDTLKKLEDRETLAAPWLSTR
jgi:DNA-binding protein YbaB